jgi:wyosine [tRNA(Phe)-imidazoG37] synthetase (radical SAM superfamily)
MKYLFGPVNSRRLGLSLGIDIVPVKICNYNCIYCEVGATTELTCERREYVPTGEVLDEIDLFLQQTAADRMPDVFTITGSGEPTLHSGIGLIIRHLKERTTTPVAVLTNGSLMHLESVREDLKAADIVIPSLDAARPESFRRINRPARGIDLPTLIEGLRIFSSVFQGRLWLEILVADGINDSPADIAALAEAVRKIAPERVQLNTVARPPLEKFARPVPQSKMEDIARRLALNFSGRVEIVADFAKKQGKTSKPVGEGEILQMLLRRPCTVDDVSQALTVDRGTVESMLQKLTKEDRLLVKEHGGKKYYQTRQDS